MTIYQLIDANQKVRGEFSDREVAEKVKKAFDFDQVKVEIREVRNGLR